MTKSTAKLFMHGRSQAVRLPKEFRMPGTEVEISKSGGVVTLRPLSASRLDWKAAFAEMDKYPPLDDDFMSERFQDQAPRDSFDIDE
jgi:antitoxin VapB